MSATSSMLSYLKSGRNVTTRQARTMFKVSNIADLVYRLRNEGTPIYTNRSVNSRGFETFTYRLGVPSAAFLGYLESRHIARARKTLYRNAISVAI